MGTLRQSRWELAFAFATSHSHSIDSPERFADEYDAVSDDLDCVAGSPERPNPTPEDFAHFYV